MAGNFSSHFTYMFCLHSHVSIRFLARRSILSPEKGGGGGRVLPYFSYVCKCRLIGYGFRGAQSLNRVSSLALWSFDGVPKPQALALSVYLL